MAAATWLYPQRGTVLLRASMPSIGLGRATGDKPQLEKYVAAATVGHAGLSGGAKGDRAGTLWIADARPVLNAQVTRLKGGGAELDIPNLSFHNIENIHVMRASASLLVAACTPSIGSSRTSDGDAAHAVASAQPAIADGGFLAAVDQSKWLQYVATVLAGATSVAELLHGRVDPRTGREVDATSVLVHCSDGWDRTAQLCAIAQLILDPFFRALLRDGGAGDMSRVLVHSTRRVARLKTHTHSLSFFLSSHTIALALLSLPPSLPPSLSPSHPPSQERRAGSVF
jgi:myotubularin-related protein 1/2